MATKNLITLTDQWVEVADGAVLILLIDGSEVWINQGALIPSNTPPDNSAYLPVTATDVFYSYSGTQKTFARKSPKTTGSSMVISVTEIS